MVVRIEATVSSCLERSAATIGARPPKHRATAGKGSAKCLDPAVAAVTFARMAEAARPTILLVEDERSIAEPFAGALAREGFEPVIAATAQRRARAVPPPRPAASCCSTSRCPTATGARSCRELRRESAVPIIMLTARGTETDRVVGLELGADDYVVKPFSSAEVIARIRAVLRRSGRDAATTPDPPVEIDGLRLDPGARSATLDGAPLELSRKEFDLLARLMRDAGRVVTREDLMSDVWDENWFGSTKTLDVHIGFLRRKLDDDAAEPRFLHTVRGVGFRFTGADGHVSLRARLLIALGYLVALVIVAFAVPLGLEPARPRRRRGARRRAAPRPTCSPPASRPADRRRATATALGDARRDASARAARARVVIVDRARPRARRHRRPGGDRGRLLQPPGAGRRAGRRPRSRTSAARTRSTRTSSPPPRRCSTPGGSSARCG